MANYVIEGGTPLYGSVRLGGAKNASFKLMIASLLAAGESRLLNFSHISDVDLTRDIIVSLGGKITSAGERTLFIDPRPLKSFTLASAFGQGSRASTMFIGPLLHRFCKAIVPLPGGDKLGRRPLDRHFQGLRALGATIKVLPDHCELSCTKLHGATFTFAKPSHTGTETLILAAVVFCIGLFGVITRRNTIGILLGIELMLNSVNINLVAFARYSGDVTGMVFTVFTICITVTEAALGLAIVILLFRVRRTVTADHLDLLKG